MGGQVKHDDVVSFGDVRSRLANQEGAAVNR
jgi:hypothetical protein